LRWSSTCPDSPSLQHHKSKRKKKEGCTEKKEKVKSSSRGKKAFTREERKVWIERSDHRVKRKSGCQAQGGNKGRNILKEKHASPTFAWAQAWHLGPGRFSRREKEGGKCEIRREKGGWTQCCRKRGGGTTKTGWKAPREIIFRG